ncbi:MAG TPA: MBL fold metallo-hydrolase [Candidatus Paceibacterota bacterium]|nr:MBL fold metallo-hydrolase [Candidatus Paceibacterota bacterium]
MKLTFCGGASTVTGSNFLIETKDAKVLVDCGLEQGSDFSVKEMYGPFPYDPESIDALVVTHAHLDHVGRIPKLVKEGFKGAIYSTPPTKDLAELIMRDSANILAGDAKRRDLPPLYEEKDIEAALSLWQPVNYHEETEIKNGTSFCLRNTGHILGSASVRIKERDGSAVALTGDLGNSPSPLLPDSEPVEDADALLMESVYGDRLHPPQAERVERLLAALKDAAARGGAILIPAFSLERTQLMLYELSNFFAAKQLPELPVFLDSPLAINVTALYEKWGPSYFKPATQDEIKREGSIFEFPFLTKTLKPSESQEIEKAPRQKIIIAGAGMSHGGRIGNWERKYLPDPSTTLIIVGYQAPGSPGRRMVEGERRVRVGGEMTEINAKVVNLEGWSAHADRDELLKFAQACLAGKRVKTIFTALGEPSAERFLAQRIHDYLGGTAVVPRTGDTWEITKDRVIRS